ncbi:MAG: hypothetical protein C4576_26575 [Desulfobacteraceae bacterium]|nr:MAG: hypothetical protein C4576_26575 [Desulfobacteraceae bacterium]
MFSGMRTGMICAAMIGAQLLISGCDYARMRNDEAVDRYEMEFPSMPQDILPQSGEEYPLITDPEKTKNPLAENRVVLASGRRAYEYYCKHCHGESGEGKGTVGQSFAPLPTDLRSSYVQEQGDGQIFERIGKGYRRHPPMAYTLSSREQWAVVAYIRSMKKRE